MTRNPGPQDTLTTRNGGTTVTNGDCLPPRNQPQPTDGDGTPFDRISDVLFWVGAAALVVTAFSLWMAFTIFLFLRLGTT